MKNTIRVLALVTAITVSGNAMAQASDPQGKPTIVLVHGAFAETSSWNAVITELNRRGYMAATQRPVTQAALTEVASVASWKTLPSYMIYGSDDRTIPPAVMSFMAERADAVKTVVVEGGSHAVMVSHPGEVSSLIEEAASVNNN